jgi:hypothetical protein
MRYLLVVVVLAASLAACKGDHDKCEQACRNYGTLVYWKKIDAEIAALPAAERDAHRRKRLGEFSSLLENGVDHCINSCTSANNDDQTDCMIKAKTADTAEACVKD